MIPDATPEPVWLRGPVPGISPALQPAAHALLQAREDLGRLIPALSVNVLNALPGGAASIAFHVQHLTGSLDRLTTYARGERLSAAQREQLKAETAIASGTAAEDLLRVAVETIERALDQLRTTPDADLDAPRLVGRAALPSTVRGVLFHAAEHTARHLGQISTTIKVLGDLK